MPLRADAAPLPPVESTGLPHSRCSRGEVLFAEALAARPGSGRADAGRGVPARAAVRWRRTPAARALLAAAAAAAVAAGCASHLARPAPAAAVAGRCGVEPGVCLLGVPAPLDEGGEASGWQCLGLHGGADAVCPLPEAAAQSANAERPALRAGTLRPASAPRVAGAEPARRAAAIARRTAAATQDAPARPAAVSPRTRAEIAALLAAKAQRTPAQRKVGSQLLDAAARARQAAEGGGLPIGPRGAGPDEGARAAGAIAGEWRPDPGAMLDERAPDLRAVADERAPVDAGPLLDDRAPVDLGAVADERAPVDAGAAADGRVAVDIRAEVTPEVLARIGTLGGAVVNSVPRYRAIRARLPLAAVEPLAEMAAVRSIRFADEAATHQAPGTRSVDRRAPASAVRRKLDTSEGDVAHQADRARLAYGIDGAGIGIGVVSNGVDDLALLQNTGDLPGRVTVLAGQAGVGTEGTAMLEIVHDLAPGADLYYATAQGGEAQYAANIEALCAAGADVIVDDVFYHLEPVFQDGVIAQGINAAVAGGCFHFSSAGNAGNLNDGTSGVWEGDYAAGGALTVNGEAAGVLHDFGGGLHENPITKYPGGIVLQWADPLGASANDYDLFLIDAGGNVIASSTTTQSGSQDPIEYISGVWYRPDARLVVVKAAGADRYLRVSAIRGELELATAGNTFGHSAAANAIGVAAVDVGTAKVVFDGTESVRTYSSDGPRRVFFQPDGAPITADDFSSTGGTALQKPDLAAADGVSTRTPGFRTFSGTSAAAPHAAAIAALLLEAAGGADGMTLDELRAALAASALDIEAEGVDRDSGAGIVMAPGAAEAVAVAPADRNRAPAAAGTLADRTLAPGAGAVTIDLATRFADPDGDPLTWTALSSHPDRAPAALTGSLLRLTPVAPSRAVVTVRATDPDGLAAVRSFSVTVTAGDRDYDLDDDGLIEIATLAQLDAVRYDLDGDGAVEVATDWAPYGAAFPEAAIGMGCAPIEQLRPWLPRPHFSQYGCGGYELTADLDFDPDGSGAGAGDAYWNGGSGWAPIGTLTGGDWFWPRGDPFRAVFEGNGHTIANLFIHRPAEDGVGLFAHLAYKQIRDLGLVDVDVTGHDYVGSLAGHSGDSVIVRSHATGRVSGHDVVGGLFGGGLTSTRHSWAAVRVSGTGDGIGGLAGIAYSIRASHASGRVSGTDMVGGLVGFSRREIRASHAAGRVSGRGTHASERYVCHDQGGVGGLAGHACGRIEASYAAGAVSGEAAVGGLVGSAEAYRVLSSYWDLDTSGVRVGIGSDDEDDNGRLDGAERRSAGVSGLTTAALQGPTGYDGIYEAWNLDMNEDGVPENPWRFGTAAQYPVLAADLDGDGEATWEEFGYQLREGPTLSAATTGGRPRVVLAWTAADAGHWSPAPDVTYTLTRDDGAAVATLAEGLRGLRYTDAAVTVGAAYAYQVTAVVTGGGAARSARIPVVAGAANQPPAAAGTLADRTLRVGGAAVVVDVAGAFADPEGDALAYAASSSAPAIAAAGASGGSVTVAPVAAGTATIAVTATDPGSNRSATQRFRVTVVSAAAVDYDADDDGLIEIRTLAQLDAVRHDLDGDGTVRGDRKAAYDAAFPDSFERMGCSADRCSGYELVADLDFDTNGSGAPDAGDAWWNDGAGWLPVGGHLERWAFLFLQEGFRATFEGNGHTIANLFIKRDGGVFVGLFGRTVGSSAVIRNLGLVDVDVTGRDTVGGLVGWNLGTIAGSFVTGRVAGDDHAGGWDDFVGGLVGKNEGTIAASHAAARVAADDAVGGLAGSNRRNGTIIASRATGRVAGDNAVGGLAGSSYGAIVASYATGDVVGDPGGEGENEYLGGLAGVSYGTITAAYAIGRVAGDSRVGGLVGKNEGAVTASYAAGRVVGGDRGTYIGGLVGNGSSRAPITASYWDRSTSGHETGRYGIGRTTASLQAPTGYTGIYATWNLDLDGDGAPDSPWDFGTAEQYPVLSVDVDQDGQATWQEFGYQLRAGPALTATAAADRPEVALSWTPVTAAGWSPAPGVAYTLTRDDGATVDTLVEEVGDRRHTDTGVAGVTYTYQVAAVAGGGVAGRSAPVSVTMRGNRSPVAVGALPDRTLRARDSATVEVAAAFRDPEGDALTYGALSSSPAVAAVGVSGDRLTIAPAGEGRTTVTVTATDVDGSNTSAMQQFAVTVLPATAVDHDSDDDGLIDIRTLAQLDAVRHDKDGDGAPTADGAARYAAAFPDQVACGGAGCTGYELRADLDFDTDGDGSVGPGDAYWYAGAGWTPIGESGGYFAAIFEGNGHAIRNLLVDRSHYAVSRRYNAGLFYTLARSSVIRDVRLLDVDVRGRTAGGLAGSNYGTIDRCQVTGRVSGTFEGGSVGGLAGSNYGTIDRCQVTGRVSGTFEGGSVGGLVGSNYGRRGVITRSSARARVSGYDGRSLGTGGLVGSNNSRSVITGSYATGQVSGNNEVGGLVGYNINRGVITGSYATGQVSGNNEVGGLVGYNGSRSVIIAGYATGPVSGNRDVGGLVGSGRDGVVRASYATGRVSGNSVVGGLIGYFRRDGVRASYWDTTTSGRTGGTGGQGETTAALQAPTDYNGIYGSWNLDLDGDGARDDPWDFGTGAQYPALSADLDGDGDATWEEFGYQLRSGPALTAAGTAGGNAVALSWTAVDAGHWEPPPEVTYTVTRDDGATVTVIAEAVAGLGATDTGVVPGAAYTYQVSAVVDGGAATHSAPKRVVAGNLPPLPVGTLADRTLRVEDAAVDVDVAAAFSDPENDVLTYGAASSAPAVAGASVSGTTVRVTPLTAGTATITVAATDAVGSGGTAAQSFRVTVANRSPVAADALGALTLPIADGAAAVDVSGAFLDPDGDPLTYAASSSAPGVATVEMAKAGGPAGARGPAGSTLMLTPRAAGEATVTVTATDAVGSGGTAAQSFRVTVPEPVHVDYDLDDDGLIEIATLAQLDAVRHDLDGDGVPAGAGEAAASGAAASGAATARAAAAPRTAAASGVATARGESAARGAAAAGSGTAGAGTAAAPRTAAPRTAAPRTAAPRTAAPGVAARGAATAPGESAARGAAAAGSGEALAPGAAPHAAAFPDAAEGMGCPGAGCRGYELAADLDFDTDGSGAAGEGDAYWTGGAGWRPLGALDEPFTGVFSGNGRTVSHLFVGGGDNAGLFGMSSGVIRGVGVVAADVTGSQCAGALAGLNGGRVEASWSTGAVTGDSCVGGLVGVNGLWAPDGGTFRPLAGFVTASWSSADATAEQWVGGLVGYNNGTVAASYATGAVSATTEGSGAGGLVGRMGFGGNRITASYATGAVSGPGGAVGGLVGHAMPHDRVTASYWDTETSGVTSGGGGAGRTSAALQEPTGYTGPYAGWDVDVDGDGVSDAPWDFGTSSEYPALSMDADSDGVPTWRELGLQGRTFPRAAASGAGASSGGAPARAWPVAFTDDPLVPGVAPVRAVHLLELRSRIGGLRLRAGLPAFGWTDAKVVPGVTPARAVHLTELRSALGEAYAAAGRPAPGYTDAAVTPGVTAMRAVQLQELRRAVAALEGVPVRTEP